MEIVDVTLRESIYLTGIDYDNGINYLHSLVNHVSSNDLQYVEIGYLDTEGTCALGYNENYINTSYDVLHNYGFKIVAMLHPDKVDISKWNKEIISKLDLVRIIFDENIDLNSAQNLINYLHDLYIKTSSNITYAFCKDDDILSKMCLEALSLGADYLYFADSSGSATAEDIDRLSDLLNNLKVGNAIGIHLHDNLNMAFANAIRAFNRGIDFTDVSITGAGKKGGNLKMEYMLPYMRKLNCKGIDVDLLKNFISLIRFFNNLINRNTDYYEQGFLNTYVGLFKIPLKNQKELELLANGDSFKYTDLVETFLER